MPKREADNAGNNPRGGKRRRVQTQLSLNANRVVQEVAGTVNYTLKRAQAYARFMSKHRNSYRDRTTDNIKAAITKALKNAGF